MFISCSFNKVIFYIHKFGQIFCTGCPGAGGSSSHSWLFSQGNIHVSSRFIQFGDLSLNYLSKNISFPQKKKILLSLDLWKAFDNSMFVLNILSVDYTWRTWIIRICWQKSSTVLLKKTDVANQSITSVFFRHYVSSIFV